MIVTSIVTQDITQLMRDDLTSARLNAESAWQEAGRHRAALEDIEDLCLVGELTVAKTMAIIQATLNPPPPPDPGG